MAVSSVSRVSASSFLHGESVAMKTTLERLRSVCFSRFWSAQSAGVAV